MFNESDLLAQFASLDTNNQQIIKLEYQDENEMYAKTHCGVISSSNVSRLCTYQPSQAVINQLRAEIAELNEKIASSTNGKVKTATKERDSKQQQLDRMLSNDLSDAAIEWIEELAMQRIAGFNAGRHVDFKSKATDWGNLNEPLAIEALKDKFSDSVFKFTNNEQRFITLDNYSHVGATPDAVIYEHDKPFMTVDVKCPYKLRIHRKNRKIRDFAEFKSVYPVYYWQFTHQMMCAVVKRHLWVSYAPDMPKPHDLITRVFGLVESDAEFLRARIATAERIISSIMSEYDHG